MCKNEDNGFGPLATFSVLFNFEDHTLIKCISAIFFMSTKVYVTGMQVCVIPVGETDSGSPAAVLDCYCCLFLFENGCYVRADVCSLSHSNKQLWQKLLQSFCAI